MDIVHHVTSLAVILIRSVILGTKNGGGLAEIMQLLWGRRDAFRPDTIAYSPHTQVDKISIPTALLHHINTIFSSFVSTDIGRVNESSLKFLNTSNR